MEKEFMRFPKLHLFTVILIMLVILLIAMAMWVAQQMIDKM